MLSLSTSHHPGKLAQDPRRYIEQQPISVRRTTSEVSSVRAYRRCVLCEFYGSMGCLTLDYRNCPGLWWCQGWCMHRRRGADLSLRRTSNELMYSSATASAAVSSHQTYQNSVNSWQSTTTWVLCRHCCRTSSGKARLRSSGLHWATTYQHQTTSEVSSVRAHRHCMLCEFYSTAPQLSDVGLQEVSWAVVVSRLTYASTAWGGFITATDIQRVDAFLRHSKHCGFFSSDLPDFSEQLAEYDDCLFNRIHSNSQHVLYSLLPPPSAASQNYHLRP